MEVKADTDKGAGQLREVLLREVSWNPPIECFAGGLRTDVSRGSSICLLSLAACGRAGPKPGAEPPVTSYRVYNFVLDREGVSETIRGAAVTAEFFPVTKALTLLGRVFIPAEYSVGAVSVAVLSNRLWQQKFKADPRSIGTAVQLNGQNFTIVGVMPSAFDVPPGVDLWVPKGAP